MADIGLVRKRLRAEIDASRKAAAARRERATRTARDYEEFLESIAVPVVRAMANALRAEGIPFEAQTPSGGARLVPERSRDEAIEIALDTSTDPPQALIVSTWTRGSRARRNERPIKDGADIAAITEDELLERLMEEIRPWLG